MSTAATSGWRGARQLARPFIGLILVLGLGVVLSPRGAGGAIIFLSGGNLTDILLQQG